MKKIQVIKENKKGFTLIEIVIVIVIIAILASMLVPSMLSWVDNANKKTFLSASNTIKTSVTTIITEKYAKGDKINTQGDFTTTDWQKVSDLVGKTVANEDATYNVIFSCATNKLVSMQVSNEKYTVSYNTNGGWNDVVVNAIP